MKFTWIIATLMFSQVVNAAGGAISIESKLVAQEIESLVKKVDSKDPSRMGLYLKWADALFDASIEVDKKNNFSPEDMKISEGYRKQALHIYDQVLSGINGSFAKPSEELAHRITFQKARIYSDLGEFKKAQDLWTELSSDLVVPLIRREALLRRAEVLEVSQSAQDLKQALDIYEKALSIADTKDLVSYVTYRKAWTEYRLGLTDQGLETLGLALEKSDASSRDQIIQDYILFLSRSTMSVEDSILTLEGFEKKYKKTNLVQNLSDAYSVADQRNSYLVSLAYLNKKDPQIDRYIKILEFQYGSKNIDLLSETIAGIEKHIPKISLEKIKALDVETEKRLYRLVVQFDGERVARADFKPLMQKTSEIYVKLFPATEQTPKVVDGWLAAVSDEKIKQAQILKWAEVATGSEKIRLYKIGIAFSLKNKSFDEIIALAPILVGLSEKDSEKREFEYQVAKAQYEKKNFAKALPVFQKLAALGQPFTAPDEISIFSQNLALDILSQNKNYSELMTQSSSWIQNQDLLAKAKTTPSLQKEVLDMGLIYKQAEFALALDKKDKAALITFVNYCMNSELMPQSCNNAKALASDLKDHEALIKVLQKLNDTTELMTQYEFAGYFKEAAALIEKANKNLTLADYIKLSVLFELGNDENSKNRNLKKATDALASSSYKTNQSFEYALIASLSSSGLLNSGSLKNKWSQNSKAHIAALLVLNGRMTVESASKDLFATCEANSQDWETVALNYVGALYEKQKAIAFYGKNSESKFLNRTKAIKEFAQKADCVASALSYEKRAPILARVESAYKNLGTEIIDTPVPAEVQGDVLAQVQEQLTGMSEPYFDMGTKYAELKEKAILQSTHKNIDFAGWTFPSLDKRAPASAQLDNKAQALLVDLKAKPEDLKLHQDIKNHFESTGNTRLSQYFGGRIQALSSAGEGVSK